MSNPICDVIHVLKTEQIDKSNRIDIRIVKWEKGKTRVLERRRMWEKDGLEKTKQATGFSRDDLAFVAENLVEIEKLLEGGSNEVR